jgi:UDP-N-acetylglucosamine 2-epimerase (non-hydrolysing)
MLEGIERVLIEERPDWVLVYGDTNSTIAAALASVKLHLPLAHLEAGLRSFNRRMPEEHNRVLTDHAADLLLAPTDVAMGNLAREGLAERSLLVGDVMTDVLYATRDAVATKAAPFGFGDGGYLVATLHRPDNTDDPARLQAIIDQLVGLPLPVLLLAHPRLIRLATEAGMLLERGAVRVVDPLPYPDLVSAVMHSAGVVTDSGGLQKEAFLLRVPCTTVRPETEWVETVELGWNVLVGADLPALADAATRAAPAPTDAAPYGTGHAADAVADALLSRGS